MPPKYWTQERIVEAFKHWERKHRQLPTTRDWARLPEGEKRNASEYPTSRTVMKVFGTWNAGLAAYAEHKEQHQKRWKAWTKEEIIDALRAWTANHGEAPALSDLKSREIHLPSPTVIKARFGSWQEALQAAGVQPRPTALTKKAIAKYRPLPRRGDTDAV